jgi:hypothetical protein
MWVVTHLLPILPNLLVDQESDGEVLVYAGPGQPQAG